MHATSLLLLAGSAFGVAHADGLAANSTRLALSNSINDLTAPMGWANIDLAALASEGLAKRRAMTYCANQNSVAGSCVATSTTLSGALATLLKTNSDSNTCRTSSGSANGIAWSFTTAPSGNCKTTATEGTIEGGLNRYFDYLGNQICGVHCVRLDHGGTYRAYITLGPSGSNLGSVACSSSSTYVDCGNGGENDS